MSKQSKKKYGSLLQSAYNHELNVIVGYERISSQVEQTLTKATLQVTW